MLYYMVILVTVKVALKIDNKELLQELKHVIA